MAIDSVSVSFASTAMIVATADPPGGIRASARRSATGHATVSAPSVSRSRSKRTRGSPSYPVPRPRSNKQQMLMSGATHRSE